jgi:bifunctional non-homologous end joining protein LigD
LRERIRPGLGLIEPCLPSQAPPSGPGWLHEIKHDGFRILARRDGAGVRLITRAGNDFSSRFPFIATAVKSLLVRSCFIDGEAIVCDETGLAVFDLIRGHRTVAGAVHCAFDLLELYGKDLQREPIEKRKQLLKELLLGSHLSIMLNEHFEEDGAIVFSEACRLGCEGIVSKRIGSPYRSGRSPHWLKIKNPKAPAVNARQKRIGGNGSTQTAKTLKPRRKGQSGSGKQGD